LGCDLRTHKRLRTRTAIGFSTRTHRVDDDRFSARGITSVTSGLYSVRQLRGLVLVNRNDVQEPTANRICTRILRTAFLYDMPAYRHCAARVTAIEEAIKLR